MRSERYSNEDEIRSTLHCFSEDSSSGGAVLHFDNGTLYTSDHEGNTIILGVPGSGKTRRCIIPEVYTLAKAGESMLIVDPKGEIYQATACLVEDQYDEVHVIDLRRLLFSDGWNPLTYIRLLFSSGSPKDLQKAEELLDELAFCLYPTAPNVDPFWAESARSLFIGVVRTLLEKAEPDQITMASVFQMIAKGDQKFSGSTYLQRFAEELPQDSITSWELLSYTTTASETRGGIRSVFLNGLSIFARSNGLRSMLSSDDLDIGSLDGEKRTAIYIILPDESKIYDKLAGILCSQIMTRYIDLAQSKYNGRLPVRLNVCLEELGNIGSAIPNLAKWMTSARSRNIRIQCVLQSLSQLTDTFGSSQATTITNSADTVVAFRINHWETLTDLSRKCGEREAFNGSMAVQEPLITQCQLAAMETGQALVIISGRTKYIEWFPDYSEMFDLSHWTPPKERRQREDKPLSFFDLSAYVKNALSKRIDEVLSGTRKEEGTSQGSHLASEFRIHAEGASDKARASDQKGESPKKPFTILVSKGKCRTTDVAEAIAAVTGRTILSVLKELEFKSCEVGFSSRNEAEEFARIIRRLGGSVTRGTWPKHFPPHMDPEGTGSDGDSLPF